MFSSIVRSSSLDRFTHRIILAFSVRESFHLPVALAYCIILFLMRMDLDDFLYPQL